MLRARRKREILRRGAVRVGRMGMLAASVGFGVDARVLGVSCGFVLRVAMAAFWALSVVVESIAVWFMVRVYGVAMWTVKTLLVMLDWVGATY